MEGNALISTLLFVVGLALLIKGSDAFIEGAAYIARYYRVSEAIIGITLVSMGTSLPELASDTYASYLGKGLLAVGDIVGSNITNVALVLGLGVAAVPGIAVNRTMAVRDGFIMLIALSFFAFLAWGDISRLEGTLLLLGFASYLFFLYRQQQKELASWVEVEEVTGRIRSIRTAFVMLVVGGGVVFLGSRLVVDGAVTIARILGVAESIIGATIMAFGTSVPELAVTVGGLVKKHTDISVGNIIGSNIFNVMWIIGVSSLVRPLPVDDALLFVHIPVMLAVSFLLVFFMLRRGELLRWQGVVFLLIYTLFVGYNYF
ncbi:MAG: sodium:calcium antiporter [Nitrospinota bacterium]|nr:MAG: sodium:calcium antiporter [Nitrospinota bacterium]